MWLSDLQIVLPDEILEHGSIQIENGKIAQIIEGTSPVDGPDMSGLTAIPGIIDLHGDMLERDVQPRPNARFPTELGLIELDKRLAGCGITTAYAAISFAWKTNDLRSQESAYAMINAVDAMTDQLLVDMKVHARFDVMNQEAVPILEDLLSQQKVQLVSIMDHTPGQGQYANVDRYIKFMHRWLGVSEDILGDRKEELLERMKENIEEKAQQTRDWAVIQGIMDQAKQHNIPVASHDDDTVEKVEEQAAIGVTISEFPVSIVAAETAHKHGMPIIMGAPNAFRGQSTSDNLSARDAIKAGLVDILATDYYPAAPLLCAFKLAEEGILPLTESVKLVSTNPAKAMKLNDRGQLTEGMNADIVLVEDGEFPRVRGTIHNGTPIFWDAHMAQLSEVTSLPH